MQDDPEGTRVSEAMPAQLYSGQPPLVPFKPREKLRSRGIRRVTDTELLALILGNSERRTLERLVRPNGLIHRETLSIGSLNTTRTHPREILYPAIEHTALGFILAHNHPSGSLDPSDEDVAFSRAVHRAGELMGIELYDHVIVAPAGYTSLRERGAF